jgi:hypothetical protein
MADGRKARDLDLLDALDALPRERFDGTVWRVTRDGRDPPMGHPSAGRWDPGTFDVLYTSLHRDGAAAEISFLLSRQPVYPSHIRFNVHEIAISASAILRFDEMKSPAPLGVEERLYADVRYGRTREIGDAAQFLGFDGLIAPSARWACLNLVLFTDRFRPGDLVLTRTDAIDVHEWRRSRQRP